MFTPNLASIFIMGFTVVGLLYTNAEEDHLKPYVGSKNFQKLKSLAGKWEGQSIMKGENKTVSLEYSVSSAGSALIETLFMGTPHEMVSVYHDEGDTVAMTHYCALANRPHLILTNASGNTINFEFGGINNDIDPDKDYHIHALEIVFNDANTIIHKWTSLKNGKEKDVTTINLKRVSE